MNGAQSLIAAALSEGIEVCFANPGTTELPLVLALDEVPGIRSILCLHENVATGAADGYGRMLSKPAMCLLHLGPGLANGLTNLHNARRAGTPLLNVIGEHATWHIQADPLLASNIEALAHTFSASTKRSTDAQSIAVNLADAIHATRLGGGIATLIVPHDCQLAEAGDVIPARRQAPKSSYSPVNVCESAKALQRGRSAILLGGKGLSEAGLKLAGRIAAATGADLLCDTFFARMERGGDLPTATRLPYFPDQALALTRRYDSVVLAGTRRPVAFFGYPGLPSYLTSEEQTVVLATSAEDVLGALEALAAELNAPNDIPQKPRMPLPAMPKGELNAQSVAQVIARLQPENGIVMDEALTVGMAYFDSSQSAPHFSHLMLTGGAIGQGPGAATGAAIACPGRKVINFESDGCGAYSVQAFWTQARENLDVVSIIGSNRSYNILNVEFERAGVKALGPIARSMTGLDHPYLDWVRIGEGFGVPSVAVDSAEGLARELENALARKGPRLIEALMS